MEDIIDIVTVNGIYGLSVRMSSSSRNNKNEARRYGFPDVCVEIIFTSYN
mgnify:FL=1|jgi:hypothetical protein